MTRTKSTYLVLLTVLLAPMAAQAELTDFGPSGEYFFDTDTGLYWQDIANFLGQTQAEVEAFVAASEIWDLASQAEMEALLGASSQGGVSLTEIMGPRQLAITGGDRWVGFLDVTTVDPLLPGDPNGWLVQTNAAGLSTITVTGFQNSVELQTHGAWVNSSVNPTIEPVNFFTVAILPDTQMYVEQHPEIFEAQMDWIVTNQADENIIYVAHLGDLKDDLSCDNKDVDNGTGGGRSEWQIVNDGFSVLDAADIPYGVVPGNHDFEQISNTCPTDYSCAVGESETCAQRPLGIEDTSGATFNSVLGPSRFDDPSAPGYQPTYGDLTGSGTSSTIRDGNRRAGTNEDNFSLVDFGGVGFVIINLGYREDNNALAPGESVCASTANPEISWADGLLSDYSDRLGIVTSHAFMDENTNDPGRNRFNNYGASIYACLSDNPNLLMMLAAHERGEAWRREITGRDADLPVHSLLSDYQSANFLLPGGGVPTTDVDFRSLDGSNTFADGGFMRIMRFDLDSGVVNIETFAPPVSFADPVTGNPLTYPDDSPGDHGGHWHTGLGAGDSRDRPGLTSAHTPAISVNSATGRIRFDVGAGMDRDTAANFCFTYRGYRVGVTEPAPDDAACPITFFDP